MDASLAVNPQVKIFLYLYLPQRNILRDFYELLSEEQYLRQVKLFGLSYLSEAYTPFGVYAKIACVN